MISSTSLSSVTKIFKSGIRGIHSSVRNSSIKPQSQSHFIARRAFASIASSTQTSPFKIPLTMPLTPEQTVLIKATVPVLKDHGLDITRVFYANMIAANPSLKNIFNEANQVEQHQPRALAHALFAYASHINDLGVLSPAVELIANKHASLYIRPEQYAIVGEYLLAAMKEVLGEALTPELLEAWGAAYWQLAGIFIKKEEDIYAKADGWTDWRDFKIARKVVESAEITSFYLEPVDAKKLPAFKPGQYISVQVDVESLGHAQTRQYSLSDAPCDDYYRISVKKEAGLNPKAKESGQHPGLISNIMHDLKNVGDIIKVSHPQGDFFLDSTHAAENWPIVLVSGGVGLTALTSILNSLIARHSTRPISWIHAARSSDVRAFGSQLREIQRTRDNVNAVFFDARPSADLVQGKDYDYAGKMDLSKLDKERELFVQDPKAEYYICGPTGFMTDMEKCLMGYGIEKERIKMELFGTGGVPRALNE
jgi:nitric oxide dioxygenase